MQRYILALSLLALPSAGSATGGFTCRTAGVRPIEAVVGFGHVAGSPLILTRLTDNRRPVPVRSAQWWLDDRELRLVLTDPSAQRREVIVKARRHGRTYDGDLRRGGKRYWVRCRES
jgi:hypothetical protein